MESSMNPKYSVYMFGTLPTTTNHLATTAAITLRLGDALRRRLLLRFSLKSISLLGDVPHCEDACHERALRTGFNCYQWSFNALSSAIMSLSFFNGDKSRSDSKSLGSSQSRTPRRNFFDGRQWTNILLAANVIVYVAQSVSDGNLLFLGAKINSLISKGQLWRLVTSAFLHANIGHLLVNCYSLNSIGPTVENMCGPKRFLTIYIGSAIASASMSYWFCKAPAVGASGAIFGLVLYAVNEAYSKQASLLTLYTIAKFLVGSFAMFVLRHRSMVKGTENDLKHIAQVIVLNMAIGLLSQGIDNWGHAGGLLGGAAVSWLIGPAWELQSIALDGRRIFEDRAPIFNLTRRHPK